MIDSLIPATSGLGKLSRLPRRKGDLKKALIERAIAFRTPNSWSDSAPSLDEIELLLQSTKDSDLRKVEAALKTDVPEESLRFIAM